MEGLGNERGLRCEIPKESMENYVEKKINS